MKVIVNIHLDLADKDNARFTQLIETLSSMDKKEVFGLYKRKLNEAFELGRLAIHCNKHIPTSEELDL